MNILVVASLKPLATAEYLVHALCGEGHDVFVCSDFEGTACDLLARGAVDVYEICSNNGLSPELMLFIEGGSMRLFPVGLEKLECLTAWYGIDTHMDYAKHLRIGRLFDITFVAQKEYVDRLRADGLRQVHWLPLAFAPELMPESMASKTLDLAHVGSDNTSANPPRHRLLEALRPRFPSHYFGTATPAEMVRIYSGARLVFNRSVNNDVNMRFFEATGAGAALVTDPIIENGVEELFEENVHYFVYRDEASLLSVIEDLLADPARCEAVGRAARQRVLERHTYRHRVSSLLKVLGQSSKMEQPMPEDYFAAFITLDLLGSALGAAASSFTNKSGGNYSKFAGGAIAIVLRTMGGALGLIERICKRQPKEAS